MLRSNEKKEGHWNPKWDSWVLKAVLLRWRPGEPQKRSEQPTRSLKQHIVLSSRSEEEGESHRKVQKLERYRRNFNFTRPWFATKGIQTDFSRNRELPAQVVESPRSNVGVRTWRKTLWDLEIPQVDIYTRRQKSTGAMKYQDHGFWAVDLEWLLLCYFGFSCISCFFHPAYVRNRY